MLKVAQDCKTITLKETVMESSSPFQRKPQLQIVLQLNSIILSRKRQSQPYKVAVEK